MKKQIIVLEDDPWIRAFLAQPLSADYDVRSVDDGSKAPGASDSEPAAGPVKADLRMPGMDGRSLVKSVRARVRYYRLPLLDLSYSDTSSNGVAYLRACADDSLMKPFNPKELRARIENLFPRFS